MTESEALDAHSRGQQLQDEGRHQDAIPLLTAAAAWFEEAEGNESLDLANILGDYSESLLALCRYDEAERVSSRARGIVSKVADLLDPESRVTLLPRVLGMHGLALRELGRYDEARGPLRQAVEEVEMHFGADHVEVAGHLNQFGILCKYSGRFDEADAAYRRALRILEVEFGVESPETATIYHNLGGLEHSRGDFARGEPLARKAFEIRLAAFGPEDGRTIADEVAWGGLLDGLQRYSKTIPIYERALAFYEAHLGSEHFEVAATLNNLGMAYAGVGRIEDAKRTMERCLMIKRKLFHDEGHPEIRLTAENLFQLSKQPST
jgi:tetratricopeptide (TPR) repeat protein